MVHHGEKPESSSHFQKGNEAFEKEDWVEAIREFLASIQADPRHAPSYLALLRSYEAAADEYGDPELLEQASKVCRDAGKLKLDEKQRATVDSAADRIQAQLQELKEEGD